MNNYQRHDVEPNPSPLSFKEIDTVYIHKSLNFEQIQRASKTPVEVIEWLNPSYTKNFIPVDKEPVCLFLPKTGVIHFVRAVNQLNESHPPMSKAMPLGDKTNRESFVHHVTKGEFFHKIAIDNECRISDIVYWNNLPNRNLYIDQRLVVWRPKKEEKFFFIADEPTRYKAVLNLNNYYTDNRIKKLYQ
jgi:membrane-bound lytic murein transglycosylase D